MPRIHLSFGLMLFLACLATGCGGKSNTPDAGGELQECTQLEDTCEAGLECLCCGSIGPRAVCLCTQDCSSDDDCPLAYQPTCNRPNPDNPGICTPEAYNCCWFCQ